MVDRAFEAVGPAFEAVGPAFEAVGPAFEDCEVETLEGFALVLALGVQAFVLLGS